MWPRLFVLLMARVIPEAPRNVGQQSRFLPGCFSFLRLRWAGLCKVGKCLLNVLYFLLG